MPVLDHCPVCNREIREISRGDGGRIACVTYKCGSWAGDNMPLVHHTARCAAIVCQHAAEHGDELGAILGPSMLTDIDQLNAFMLPKFDHTRVMYGPQPSRLTGVWLD